MYDRVSNCITVAVAGVKSCAEPLAHKQYYVGDNYIILLLYCSRANRLHTKLHFVI